MKFGLREFTASCIAFGSIIIIYSLTMYKGPTNIFSALLFIGAMFALGIPLMVRYQKTKELSMTEARFPDFLRDITSNIETGMTLPQAIRTVCRNDYGPLTHYTRDLSAKLEWGINFEKALSDMGKKINSTTISRSIKTINETHRSGGYIGTVLEAVAESQTILERIKKERTTSIYAQMVNGYVIYLVFLGVMYGMSNFLVPAFQMQSGGGSGLADVYDTIFGNLIVIQGLFAGLAIGKMAEGSVFAGIKHSLVLVSIGYTVFSIL
jgi:flagellar protein FlaJ